MNDLQEIKELLDQSREGKEAPAKKKLCRIIRIITLGV